MAKNFFKGIAEKLLGLDDSGIPVAQFDAIKEISSRHRFDTDVESIEALMRILKKKHLVNSICVTNRNGSMLASTNGNDLKEAITGTALFNYISSEIPRSETVLIKGKEWNILFPYKEKIFIVRAGSDLSQVELRALAKELEEFFVSKQQSF